MWWMTLAFGAKLALDLESYSRQFSLRDPSDPDYAAIERCLSSWPDHPFATPESRRFRVLEGSTRFLWFGTDPHVRDEAQTSYPQIVLVRPNVGVLAKTIWFLENPNGWYCFDTSVAVAAKSIVNLSCGAKLADGHPSVDVLGSSDREGGVTVLGKLTVNEGDCPESQ
jgi:hypothetical protein